MHMALSERRVFKSTAVHDVVGQIYLEAKHDLISNRTKSRMPKEYTRSPPHGDCL